MKVKDTVFLSVLLCLNFFCNVEACTVHACVRDSCMHSVFHNVNTV